MHVCEVQCSLLFCGMVFLTTTICSLVMLAVIAAVFSHIYGKVVQVSYFQSHLLMEGAQIELGLILLCQKPNKLQNRDDTATLSPNCTYHNLSKIGLYTVEKKPTPFFENSS